MKWFSSLSFIDKKTKAQSTSSRLRSKKLAEPDSGPFPPSWIKRKVCQRDQLSMDMAPTSTALRQEASRTTSAAFLSGLEDGQIDVLLEFHAVTHDKQVSRRYI